MKNQKGEINLIKLREVYKKIWELSFPYQDKKKDKGHAEITLSFAQQLLGQEKANQDIVIPAIILHDVGWSQLSAEERFLADRIETPPQQFREIRVKHQTAGIKIASTILEQVHYNGELSKHILEIISQHDTRVGCFSKEDALVRDADKLWRFSNTGFWIDVKRKEITPQERYDRLEKEINQEGFFFTESAKNIARKKLEERRGEF